VSKETKFGYGFLLGGIGVPYLMAITLGPLAAVIAASACTVLGLALLLAGHLHRDQSVPKIKRGFMHTILQFTVLGTLLGGAIGALSGSVWWLVQRRTVQQSAKPIPKVVDEKPPTWFDIFKSDVPGAMKFLSEDRMLIKWKSGDVEKISNQVYADFIGRTKFVGYYIRSSPHTYDACLRLASQPHATINDLQNRVGATGGSGEEGQTDLRALTFSGRVFLYYEVPLSILQKAVIVKAYSKKGFAVELRGPDFLRDQQVAWYRDHKAKP
jgi:hypothetical protein